MKNKGNRKAFVAGMVTMAVVVALCAHALAAGNLQSLQDVMVGGIRIVIDGQELHPTDVNGNPVQPMIYNGTTYLPVRAVASALNKAVYWDGPNYTVYLGEMDGQLEYPTVMLKDMTSIATKSYATDDLTDNYGNRYGSAVYNAHNNLKFEYLLNMKYTHFKGTLYVPEGETSDRTVYLTVEADGHTLYTSPAFDKTSAPVPFDVNVTGYNDIKIVFSNSDNGHDCKLCLADAGFYQ